MALVYKRNRGIIPVQIIQCQLRKPHLKLCAQSRIFAALSSSWLGMEMCSAAFDATKLAPSLPQLAEVDM